MRNNYLKKKKIRSQNKEESNITEEVGPNINNSIRSENDKSENKISTPGKSKSEQSSSTISDKNKSEEPHSKDKRTLIKQKKEEEIKILNMGEKFTFLQKQLDELKEAHERKINILEKELQSTKEQKQAHEIKINKLEKELQSTKKQKQTHEFKIYNLQKDIGTLNDQVKELNKFYFAGKLRKLLKRLIEYIIKKYYYSYMKFHMSTKRIYFVKAPRLSSHLSWAKDNEIVNALNRMLEMSFSKAKAKDYAIHFFDKKANENSSFKKIISVFENKDEFFEYFDIKGKDKKILDEIFPEKYLTIIDNASSDISLKNLINVIGNIKVEEDIDEDF